MRLLHRWIDRLSDFRKEFSYSAQRLVVASFVTLTTLHYFACLVWLTIRVQHFPPSERLTPLRLSLKCSVPCSIHTRAMAGLDRR